MDRKTMLTKVQNVPRLMTRTVASCYENTGIYGLLTKCDIRMAGFWPSFFSASLWSKTESRFMNSQKNKDEANIKPAWSIKDLLHDFWNIFLVGHGK